MKRLIAYCLTLLALACLEAKADSSKDIVLNNTGHSSETVSFEGGSFLVEITKPDYNEKVRLSLTVANTHESDLVYLFFEKKTEKELGKLKSPMTKVRYSKSFPGQRRTRITEICESNFDAHWGRTAQILCLQPGEKQLLFEDATLENGNEIVCKIPVYFAHKGKKGFLSPPKNELNVLEKVELHIKVALSPDARLLEITEEVDELATQIIKTTITVCRHSGQPHHPSEEEQKTKIQNRIDSLSSVIGAEVISRSISQNTKLFDKFSQLDRRLQVLNLDSIKVEECPLVPQKAATCGCSAKIRRNYRTLESIYSALDDYYQKLYTGKIQKEDVMEEIQAMKEHSGHLRGAADYRKAIDEYYTRILDY